MHPFYFIFLSLAGCLAGIVDTLVGGGGLIVMPALLIAGVPPTTALGTMKFQASVGECNASFQFIRHGKIEFKKLLLGIFFVLVGSIIGSLTVQKINADFLAKFIPFLLLLIFLYSIFSKRFASEISGEQRLSDFIFYFIFGLLIGFYNGFFGPATGSFWIIALIFFLGFDLKKATMHAKPLNFAGNLIALICFIYAGLVNYPVAIAMSMGQLIGSFLGAKLVIHKGVKLIRPVFIMVVLIMMIVLFLKSF